MVRRRITIFIKNLKQSAQEVLLIDPNELVSDFLNNFKITDANVSLWSIGN